MTERASPLEGGLLYAVRSFAVIRLMFMLLALVTHETRERPTLQPDRFDAVIVLGTAYAFVLLVLAVRRPQPLLAWRRLGIVDLVIVAALVVYTGGPESSLRFSYFAIPFLVAFVVRPSRVALWSLAAIGSYVAIRHGGWLPRDEQRVDAPVEEAAGVAFVVLAAVAFSAVLVRLHRSVEEHARRATALAAAIVRVEDRERRKLADELHDGAVQDIAVAAREVAAALRGDGACLEVARSALDTALEQLRGEIFNLYPHVLDHAGLSGAVDELVARAAVRGGFGAAVEVDPTAVGIDDLTVMSVLRELLSNVVKHAGAADVDVWVSNQGGSCLLVGVRDDGCGFDPPSPAEAVRARHFGLQSVHERLRALGGSLDVLSVPGSGTDATARIPIARADQPGSGRRQAPRASCASPGTSNHASKRA